MPLVLIFAKPPVEGKVKTRLIPDLGAFKATEVYRYCLNYTLKLLRKSGFEYQLWLGEDDGSRLFEGENVQVQQGSNLGERMLHALQTNLPDTTAESVLLIGSDCLDLKQSHLTQAFEALNNHDLVIIPSFDGGYALIGANKVRPELFTDVKWSSDQVLRQTLSNAERLRYRVHLLETLRDIDTLVDLNHYPALRHLIGDD